MLEIDNGESPSRNPMMEEYEKRRCTVCGARYPSFGFGPPILPKGEVWACTEHREEVERRLLRTPVRFAAELEQQRMTFSQI